MNEHAPRTLLVLSFESPLEAREAYFAFHRLEQDGVVVVRDAVFIDKNRSGRTETTETVDLEPRACALTGGYCGALIGALVAGPFGTLIGAATTASLGALSATLIDLGIPDATLAQIEGAIEPGHSALALLLTPIRKAELKRELSRFAGARLVRSEFSDETTRGLRGALRRAG